VGADTVTATYGGDTNYAGRNGSLAQPVFFNPQITSASSSTFLVCSAGLFTVTTSGGVASPSFSEVGNIPAGVTFIDNGNGAATIGGTPEAGRHDR
jgi:hypothetical protein